MIVKLDQSAKLLAQSEREGAWREMAKQVAHEIKNPLTPMKLSIQYLQHAFRSNPDNIEPLLKRDPRRVVEVRGTPILRVRIYCVQLKRKEKRSR